MDRRRFLLTSLAGALAAPLGAGAQQSGKVYRVGYLTPAFPTSGEDPRSDRPPEPFRALFREQLRQYGWIAGRNLSIEYRYARGDPKRLPDLAAELTQLPVDVIFCATGAAAQAAVEVARGIPIVFGAGDALAQGLTSSLARPDRNATGLSVMSVDLTPKRLELLKEALPRISRVAVMRCLGSEMGEEAWQQAERTAGLLRLTLLPLGVRSREDVNAAFATARKQADAVFVPDCPLFNALTRPSSRRAASRRCTRTMISQRRRLDGLRTRLARCRAACGVVRGQDPPRLDAESVAYRAADEIRANDQPQDRQGPRPDDPALAAGAGRPDHRVTAGGTRRPPPPCATLRCGCSPSSTSREERPHGRWRR